MDNSTEMYLNVEAIKFNTFVKRKQDAKSTYTRKGYNASIKKYELQNTDDINHYIYVKKGTRLYKL